jgi:hypothetical protein
MIDRKTKNIGPHIGIIKFDIMIHKMFQDGTVDPQMIDCSDLFADHEMSNLGEIHVVGFDKWDCVKRVKEKLESLSDNNGKK